MTKINYTKGPRNHPINLIVIHTAECQELSGVAKRIASWFKTQPSASAHFVIDNKDTIPVIATTDIAWHSGHWDTNVRSLGYEISGVASQTTKDWSDTYSLAVLDNTAKKVAADCKTFKIPVVHLTTAQLAKGGTGIVGHADVSKAFSISGGHVDPGINFPWVAFIALVKKYSK